MSLSEILLSVVFCLAAGTAIALTVSGATPDEFLWAKGLYVLAALALAAAYCVWLRQTWDKPLLSDLARVALGAFVAVLVIAGVPLLFSWVNTREWMVAEVDLLRDGARFLLTDEKPDRGADDTYTFPILVENKGKYPTTSYFMMIQNRTISSRLSERDEAQWVNSVEQEFKKRSDNASSVGLNTGNSIGVDGKQEVRNPGFHLGQFNVTGILSGKLNLYTVVIFKYSDALSDRVGASYYQVHCSWYHSALRRLPHAPLIISATLFTSSLRGPLSLVPSHPVPPIPQSSAPDRPRPTAYRSRQPALRGTSEWSDGCGRNCNT